MNNDNEQNKVGNQNSPKPSQHNASQHEQKQPVARGVKGQNGAGQATRKAHTNVTPIDQGKDRE